MNSHYARWLIRSLRRWRIGAVFLTVLPASFSASVIGVWPGGDEGVKWGVVAISALMTIPGILIIRDATVRIRELTKEEDNA